MMTHTTTVEVIRSVPGEVEAGTEITLRVRVSCAAGCDLRGAPITVLAGEEILIATGLSSCDGAANETEDLCLKAPAEVGEHVWTVVFRRYERESVAHDESCLPVAFKTVPHATSMAVWDVPSPVLVGHPFTVKVGVKCSATCTLAGQTVDVRKESGRRMGQATLNETPWPGTTALYVADVALAAPKTAGMSSWTACFAETDLSLPHSEASAVFSFLTAVLPDHTLTIKVIDKHTHAPVEQVDIRCGSYRASTDLQGVATLQLPTGTYELNWWKPGCDDAPPMTLEVNADLLIHVEIAPTPEKDPDDQRVWM
jgi:hypothetical protein